MKKEIWMQIEHSYYYISNYGRIRSFSPHTKGRILNPPISRFGYRRVQLSINGRKKNYLIHVLVAKAFIPNQYNKPFVNHINSNRLDNRTENLEWVTFAENVQHAFKFGFLTRKGEKNSRSRLNETQVITIFKSKHIPVRELMEQYGVSRSCIKGIHNRKNWSYLTQGI